MGDRRDRETLIHNDDGGYELRDGVVGWELTIVREDPMVLR